MHDADRRQGRLRLHGPTEGRRDCPCAVAEEGLDPGSRHRDRPAGRATLAAAVTTLYPGMRSWRCSDSPTAGLHSKICCASLKDLAFCNRHDAVKDTFGDFHDGK